MDTNNVLAELKLYSLGSGGIGSWLMPDSDPEIMERISLIDKEPLKKVQLNQLLVMGHEAPVTDGFFKYYWCSIPDSHPYQVNSVIDYSEISSDAQEIRTVTQLKWGLNRLFIDSLLFWGNVRSGYRELRTKSFEELVEYFRSKRFPSENIKKRGPFLKLEKIAKDKRYLISEMACKSYEKKGGLGDGLKELLLESFSERKVQGGGSVTIGELLSGEYMDTNHSDRQFELCFSADEILDVSVSSKEDIEKEFNTIYEKFNSARDAALINTKRYLSMVNDLDVYVATSMRTRQDFREMAAKTENIFNDPLLNELELRYFDPTLSAADGHENKGLIECLMVKCAKVLVYCAGEKESYGKDAEAAMALSLGKPVIFLCDKTQRARFYKEVHPLSRLIHFDTGVSVGSIVTDNESDVSILLQRIFDNKMEYDLQHDGNGYLRLKERLTNSIVRLQTNDRLLNETFWNHYHG